ncbi:hypothetical protein PTI98_008480 [Pleurotus ostreatus]|nr:hypothetical protein PTI98_008480 [Pleurotus ostreatus]
MTTPVDQFRASYAVLEQRVTTALRTQVGAVQQLSEVRDQVLSLSSAAEQHLQSFSAAEYATLQANCTVMANDLDAACHRSLDPPHGPTLVVAQRVHTGGRGRPRVHIDPTFLESALELRGTTHLAEVFNCSARSVRRRALELGIALPAAPVRNIVEVDGEQVAQYTSTSAPVSTLNDEELDQHIRSILESFPNAGRRMIDGHLRASGHRLPRERVTMSYLRVHGTPAIFGNRHIARRRYSVPGPNSLWHHDGQHGLIRYKIVIHCFIDGFSRFITGLRAHNNNRALTVLELFHDAREMHGDPSRVRGDHGVGEPSCGSFGWRSILE